MCHIIVFGGSYSSSSSSSKVARGIHGFLSQVKFMLGAFIFLVLAAVAGVLYAYFKKRF